MQEATNAIRQMRFPQKLWYLLDLHTDAILWGGTGRTILLNYRVLHSYLRCEHSIFKTTNISSFVRQLNLYGFRKVTSHLQDPLCNSSNPYMHEYIHDFFQFGRPELLNKITRKALTMKKSFKTRNYYGNNENNHCLTPLQKARRALQIALKKASQEISESPSQQCSIEYEDEQDEFQDEDDNIELDWLLPDSEMPKDNPQDYQPECTKEEIHTVPVSTSSTYGYMKDPLIDFADVQCNQVNDNYSAQFLSMPDLDTEPNENNSGVELLAEFNICNDMDRGIAKKKVDEAKDNSLNCVLPSVGHDQTDDISLVENNDDSNYNGEWDQMFNDIMTNRSSSQDSVSNLRELYSQISHTIDLLNS